MLYSALHSKLLQAAKTSRDEHSLMTSDRLAYSEDTRQLPIGHFNSPSPLKISPFSFLDQGRFSNPAFTAQRRMFVQYKYSPKSVSQ